MRPRGSLPLPLAASLATIRPAGRQAYPPRCDRVREEFGVSVGIALWFVLTGVSFATLGVGALGMIAWSARQRRG